MEQKDDELVIPVISEELHADAVPFETGGVRVTKRVDSHDEVLEQELRKGHVQVKRVKTDRVVDGPQPVQYLGNTIVVPVVSEVLRVEKQWVVTEEIHITQTEERERVQQKVRVNQQHADVERLDEHGNAITGSERIPETQRTSSRPAVGSVLGRQGDASSGPAPAGKQRVLSKPRSLLKGKS
jgi:stress response protein YsnF